MDEFWDQWEVTPTPQQRRWGDLFLALWSLIEATGAASGKTWFWRHVAMFLELQDPGMRAEPETQTGK